ncbi:MAG TPA: NAD(P)-binding domain-containing protein [Solirubrobacteraceae bacterium]|nr:NAD(P)-binding domain-containing protein [Solirubrobacteraceae bacterium]
MQSGVVTQPTKHESGLDTLVLDAGQRQGLVAVRELGRAGLRVGAVDSDRHSPGFASRFSDTDVLVPALIADQDAYVDSILAACARYQPSSLILGHDGSIEAVRRRRFELERVVGVALAPENALAVAVDKARTLEFAATLGLAAPRGTFVSNLDDADAAIDEVGLPAVVKPTRSWAQDGAVARRLIASVVNTPIEARAAIEDILGAGIEVAIQQWLPGDREALSFFHAHGRIWARFAQRADRTFPPLGGNSVLRESIPMPDDVAELSERLVLELGLDGYSEVEYRRDADGRPALMEINPRLSASVEIAVRAGVPFPLLLHRWASGEDVREVSGYRAGIRMRWLGGDLSWLRSVLTQRPGPDVPTRGRALRMFAGDFARPLAYDYADAGDPRPALVAATGAARRAGRLASSGSPGTSTVNGASGSAGFDTEAIVIGAGPYGLSVSAQLTGRGVRHETFGDMMSLWSKHMPLGMYLKSEGFASNLSDPDGEHTLKRFCAEEGIVYADVAEPIAIDTFERYGRWFQQRAVPRLRSERVERVVKIDGGFEATLSGGETLRAKELVVASGMTSCAYTPPELQVIPAPTLQHAYDHRDPEEMRGQDVAVFGLGQSALEGAALLHEAGANVTTFARADKIQWNSKPGPKQSLWEMYKRPRSGLGDARGLWAYARLPLAFHTASEYQKRKRAYKALGPAGAWWLKVRIVDQFPVLLQHTLRDAALLDDGGVQVTIETPEGAKDQRFDRVLAGTGYSPDVKRLDFLEPLHSSIAAFEGTPGTPVLDRDFQSSVENLYFVGYLAALSFGPVMRFVYGAEFAANRVARAVAR